MTADGATPGVGVVHRLWREQAGLLRGFVADLITALVVGVTLVGGGRQHTQATAWDVVNANGGPEPWGLALLALGGLLMWAGLRDCRRGVVWVMWALALFYLILGMAFSLAVFFDPDQGSSYVGALFVFRAMFMHVSRAQVYREGPTPWTE